MAAGRLFWRRLDRARHGADSGVGLLLAAPHVSRVAGLGGRRSASRFEMLWKLRPARRARAVAVGRRCGRRAGRAMARSCAASCASWNRRAAISRAAVDADRTRGATGPEGTLVIAGVPAASWAFAVPHAVRPPFTATDLTKRDASSSPTRSITAAMPLLWNEYTRNALRSWHDGAEHPPVVAMYWDPRTGRLSRVSDRDDPQLRTLVVAIDARPRAARRSIPSFAAC